MKMTVPMRVTHSRLLSTNLSEDPDATQWDVATTYAADDEVYEGGVGGHKLYKSVQGSNTGNDPSSDDGTWWVEIGWTNSWKALKTDSPDPTVAEDTSGITYSLDIVTTCTEVGFLGLICSSVTVTIDDETGTEIYDQTQTATETIDGVEFYKGSMIFTGLTIADGYTVNITIADPSGSDLAQVGQIVVGYTHTLGVTEPEETEVSFKDLSLHEQDEFGTFTVTQRGVSDIVEFSFKHDSDLAGWAHSLLIDTRNTPRLFWVSQALIDQGLFVFGYADEPDTPLSVTKSQTEITVEGMVYEPGGVVA